MQKRPRLPIARFREYLPRLAAFAALLYVIGSMITAFRFIRGAVDEALFFSVEEEVRATLPAIDFRGLERLQQHFSGGDIQLDAEEENGVSEMNQGEAIPISEQ